MLRHERKKRKNEDDKFSPMCKLNTTLNYYLDPLDHIGVNYGWTSDYSKAWIRLDDSKLKVNSCIEIDLNKNDAYDVIEYIKYAYKFKYNINLDEEISIAMAIAKRPTIKEMALEIYGKPKPFWKFW